MRLRFVLQTTACFVAMVQLSVAQDDVPVNLLTSAKVTASTEQTGQNHLAPHAIDRDLQTRWCASSDKTGEWIQFELKEPRHLKAIRIHWESAKNKYKYRVEVSPEGTDWKTVIDHAENPVVDSGKVLSIDAPNSKFLKITFLGSASNSWGSLWEVEASESELPALVKSRESLLRTVKAPSDFDVRLFGIPPVVNYPVCLTAAPTGEVFIGVDEQGSLGKEPGRGKILRCIDSDGDGTADQITEFAKVDHPRGLIYDQGTLWVLHPPLMTVFHDDNLDGVADRHELLLTGISTEDVAKRGADHTTNGIQLGIDGWIYIAVGDYGVIDAKGTDGTTLNKRGGGVIRVRPDGREMEFYAWGLRNILDVCIDPMMNIYTRDNTNDGGGWDVRLSQVFQSANYGYPSLYLNFKEEIMPPLADFGGGSGCGGLFLNDGRWPENYGHALYTADWGRSEVYLHHPVSQGATHSIDQETFVKIPRPTDLDVDGSGRMYISSWNEGQFNYQGPDVGFVAQLIPKGFQPVPFPDLRKLSVKELIALFNASDMKHRQHAQLELVRRGPGAETTALLESYLNAEDSELFGKVAAIYALKQLDGVRSHSVLLKLTSDPELQAVALRALTDRIPEVANLPNEPFLSGLRSPDPVVRLQALISIGRLNRPELAEVVLPLTTREDGLAATPRQHNEPDPASVIPHVAIQTLIKLNAVPTYLIALKGPYRAGALAALRGIHSAEAVNGLTIALSSAAKPDEKLELLTTLIRLYHQEGVYEKDWWGTRPDRTGPYYDRQTWSESPAIKKVVEEHFHSADTGLKQKIFQQLERHQVKLDGIESNLPGMTMAEENQPIVLPKADPSNPNLIANLPYETVFERVMKTPGNAAMGKVQFEQHHCQACHTVVNGAPPKGPHLVDIGKRYKREELIESILKPSAKIAQGFDTQVVMTTQGKIYTGFATSEGAEELHLRQADGVSVSILRKDIDDRTKQEQSMMPAGLVNDLTPEQLADLIAWLEQLKS